MVTEKKEATHTHREQEKGKVDPNDPENLLKAAYKKDRPDEDHIRYDFAHWVEKEKGQSNTYPHSPKGEHNGSKHEEVHSKLTADHGDDLGRIHQSEQAYS